MSTSSYGAAVDRLSTAQKPGPGIPAYTRWVNRPIGRRLAALAYVLRLTPNQVTALSAAVSVLGVLVLVVFPPTWLASGCAALAFLVGYALDSADGQLARLRGEGGPAGEYLDHVVDAFRQPLLHLGLAVSLFRRSDVDEMWPVAVALAFSVLVSAWLFAQTLAEKLIPKGSAAPGSTAPPWVSFAKAPYDPGFFYLVVLLLPLAGPFVAVYTTLAVLTLGIALASIQRKYAALAAVSA